MRALLIDDEHYCNQTLAFELQRSQYDIEILAQCTDSRQAKSLIEELKPDLVFMDIEMPWLSGFEVLDSLGEINFNLVFVTAYDQFALKAFNYFALNYLLKPVDQEALDKTLHKVVGGNSTSDQALSQILQAYHKSRTNKQLIALPVSDGYEFINQSDIIRCEADSNYCTLHIEGARPILISKSLKVIENMLDDRFYRVHQSHLINMEKLKKYDKSDGGFVILLDDTQVPVSRLKKGEFISMMKG